MRPGSGAAPRRRAALSALAADENSNNASASRVECFPWMSSLHKHCTMNTRLGVAQPRWARGSGLRDRQPCHALARVPRLSAANGGVWAGQCCPLIAADAAPLDGRRAAMPGMPGMPCRARHREAGEARLPRSHRTLALRGGVPPSDHHW